MTVFRVHFADAQHRDVEAETPQEAAKKARADHDRIISKIKIVRSGDDSKGGTR